MGNRESALLQAVHNPRRATAWIISGGERTRASYGVERAADIPTAELDRIAGLKTVHEDVLRYYVHAGCFWIGTGLKQRVNSANVEVTPA
jgi:serine/threonine protein phosphatase 1